MKKTIFTLCFLLGCILQVNTTLYGQPTSTTQPDSAGMGTMSTRPSPLPIAPPKSNGTTFSDAVGNQNYNACAFKPDLAITSFTAGAVTAGAVEGAGANQTRRYAINFTATIKNSGGVAAAACKLESTFSRMDQNNFFWGGYYNVGGLLPNGTQTINGVINVRLPANHDNVKVQLLIDSAAGEEFLPPFNKVDECNEGNNISSVIKVKVK